MTPTIQSTCGTCGHVGTYSSQARADAHFPRHSCQKHLDKIAAAEREKARLAAPRTIRDCVCPVAKHEHGTRQGYVIDRCRCLPCTAANTNAEQTRSRLKLYGRYDGGRVDAGPVRKHLKYLIKNGISNKQVAKVTGLGTGTVSAILYGRYERGHKPYPNVLRTTAEKILAVQPTLEKMAPARNIDSTGILRRLQALVAIGWSQQRLAQRLGMTPANFGRFMHATHCQVATALAARKLYEELWNSPQTGHDQHTRISANRARRYAAARGWVPPMAWDDEMIDNPKASPQMGEPSEAMAQRLKQIEVLLAGGDGWEQIAAQLSVTAKALIALCQKYGRHDLVTRGAAQSTRTDAASESRTTA